MRRWKITKLQKQRVFKRKRIKIKANEFQEQDLISSEPKCRVAIESLIRKVEGYVKN